MARPPLCCLMSSRANGSKRVASRCLFSSHFPLDGVNDICRHSTLASVSYVVQMHYEMK
jgi:hypothetical protein